MAVVLSLSYVLFFQWGQIQQEQNLDVEEARAAVELEGVGNISVLENDLEPTGSSNEPQKGA